MRYSIEQLDACLDIIRLNAAQEEEFNNSAQCVGYLLEQGVDKADAFALWSAAEIIDELGVYE